MGVQLLSSLVQIVPREMILKLSFDVFNNVYVYIYNFLGMTTYIYDSNSLIFIGVIMISLQNVSFQVNWYKNDAIYVTIIIAIAVTFIRETAKGGRLNTYKVNVVIEIAIKW